MSEKTKPSPVAAKPKSRKVRAIAPCYLDHILRKKGERFQYAGGPCKAIVDCSEDDDQLLAEEASFEKLTLKNPPGTSKAAKVAVGEPLEVPAG